MTNNIHVTKKIHANEHSWNWIHMIRILYSNLASLAEFPNKNHKAKVGSPVILGYQELITYTKYIFRVFSFCDKKSQRIKDLTCSSW